MLKRNKTTQTDKLQKSKEEPSIFYHEDDYRQIEIVPSDNIDDLKTEAQKVNDFASNHFDGSGFTEIYVRKDNNTELKERKITPHDLEQKLVILGLDRIANVRTGYGQTHQKSVTDCIAFGKDYSAVYYEYRDNVVQHIWFTNPGNINREQLVHCLNSLGMQWKLVLQDWNHAMTVDLSNKQTITEYLNKFEKKE